MNNTDNEELKKIARTGKKAYKKLMEIYECLSENEQRAWNLGELAGLLEAGGADKI